jgi:HK97 family phage major capsid protein
MSLIAELRAQRAKAIKTLSAKEAIENEAVYKQIEADLEGVDAQLTRALKAQERNAALARPAGQHAEEEGQEGVEGYDDDAPVASEIERLALERGAQRGVATRELAYSSRAQAFSSKFERAVSMVRAANGIRLNKGKHFRSLGEQLQAIKTYYESRGSNTDARLVRAPTGAGEVDPTGGGFLVQTDFAAAIFLIAHDMGELLGLVNKIPIGDKFNGIKIPGVDETSRLTGSRWGGVQSFWVDEGTAATPTKPKFKMIEFSLHKLMSIMYTSDELLQDSVALTAIASQAFSEEVMFMTEDAIYEGKGSGMPLGVINSPALVTQAAQAGQKTQTIVKENIDNMWSRLWVRSRKNSVWLISQDVLPQLFQLNQAVGTGGQLTFMPPGGQSSAPYATLFGRPVIETEYSPTLGTAGDILLADLSQYTLVDKGGVQAATSMHVAFLTDQQVFRITYRVDGKPMWTAPMTPFKGTNTRSPFVALATR